MQPLARYPLVGMFVVLVLALSACGGGGGGEGAAVGVPGPPTVTSRTPAPGDENVSVDDPFVATFSEAIDPSTVSNSSVVVTGTGGTLLGTTIALSGDGTTLTIDMISSPVVPNELIVTFTDSIADLSGDPLTLPADAWTFRAPDWLELGEGRSAVEGTSATDSNDPSLSVDGAGNVVVAWQEDGTSNIYVQRWNGTSWDSLGSSVSAIKGLTQAVTPSLAIDAIDNPLVAWSEYDGSNHNIYVQSWNGTSWDSLGSALSEVSGDANEPSLAIDGADNPVVGWVEQGSNFNVYVRRWTGTSWTALGSGVTAGGLISSPSLAIDGADNPVVAWQENDSVNSNIYVRRWNAATSSWDSLGTFLSAASGDAYDPSIAIDGAGNPVVAWLEDDGSSFDIYVYRWNGTSWNSLGTALSADSGNAGSPSLVIDDAGNPVVAWEEYDGVTNNIFVQAWDEQTATWRTVGEKLSATGGATDARNPSIGLDSRGSPVVAWQESDTADEKVYVRRYNQ